MIAFYLKQNKTSKNKTTQNRASERARVGEGTHWILLETKQNTCLKLKRRAGDNIKYHLKGLQSLGAAKNSANEPLINEGSAAFPWFSARLATKLPTWGG